MEVIDAPSHLGLGRAGVKRLPDALTAAGLLDGLLPAPRRDAVRVPVHVPERDARTGLLNVTGIQVFSRRLADRLERALDGGSFPLVLGGDCSILLGPMLALRRRGRFGLVFIDGHADFYSPASEPSGEVASMDLALVTGRGPAALANLEGRQPLVREEDVVVFGVRDRRLAARDGSPDVIDSGINLFDLEEVRRLGPATAARRGLTKLQANGVEGFWVHLDADVLHDDVMPAVDYRLPDGFRPEELMRALSVWLSSPMVVGLEITIYNPSLDDDNLSAGQVLAEVVRVALAARKR